MKTSLLCLGISLAVLSTGCKKEPLVLPDALLLSKTILTAEFATLDQKMAAAVVYMSSINLDTTLVRAKLLELVNEFPTIIEFAQITSAGIMKIIEPAIYHGAQGSDISSQDHVIKAFETKLPVLSLQFLAVEGFYASVVLHPIIKNGSVAGGLTALFYPEEILGHIMNPLCEGQTFELLVMQKGGRILYDQNTAEIGLNLFTDPLYKDFPELITAGNKMDAEDSGTTSYSFFKTGTTQVVSKLTYWTTYELYGTQWKLVWIKPE
jgi:hypothetical protein